jgi:hypothetical protein
MYVKYMTLVDVVGYLLYYGNTTLAGLQTLGEEYTGIIQVNSSLRTVPSFMVINIAYLASPYFFFIMLASLKKIFFVFFFRQDWLCYFLIVVDLWL